MTYCGSQVQVKAAMDASEEMFALDVFVVSHLVLRLCKFFPVLKPISFRQSLCYLAFAGHIFISCAVSVATLVCKMSLSRLISSSSRLTDYTR